MQRVIEFKITVTVPESIELPSDEIADDLTMGLLQWDETLYSRVFIEELGVEEIP